MLHWKLSITNVAIKIMFEIMQKRHLNLANRSYKEFCNVYIDKKIILEKKVYTMKSLLQKFKKIVKNVELTEAPCYKSERLRNRLENDFPNLEFHRPSFRRNSYIVYVREYTPGDIMEKVILI